MIDFYAIERTRAARHEAGHWLAYKKYGFDAGGILTDPNKTGRFGAEVDIHEPPPDAQSQIAFLEDCIRSVIAGFIAEGVRRADGKKVHYAIATEWKAYQHVKDDYARFETLVDQLAGLKTVPDGQDAKTFFFEELRPDVEAYLTSAASALDAIQDAILACKADRIEAAEIEELAHVSQFLNSLDQVKDPTV